MAAPKIRITFSPEKEGMGILSGPHTRSAVPRNVEEMPMVIKTNTIMAFDFAIRIGPLSMRAPITVTVAAERKKEKKREILKRE